MWLQSGCEKEGVAAKWLRKGGGGCKVAAEWLNGCERAAVVVVFGRGRGLGDRVGLWGFGPIRAGFLARGGS